jgi:hypothetical protein
MSSKQERWREREWVVLDVVGCSLDAFLLAKGEGVSILKLLLPMLCLAWLDHPLSIFVINGKDASFLWFINNTPSSQARERRD